MKLWTLPLAGAATAAGLACGAGENGSEVHDHRAVAQCLEQRAGNFIRDDGLDRSHELARRLSSSLRERAGTVMLFGPLDPTFGDEVDGVITSPAPTAMAFFSTAEAAEQFEVEADERRGNALLFYSRDPSPSQRAALDACL